MAKATKHSKTTSKAQKQEPLTLGKIVEKLWDIESSERSALWLVMKRIWPEVPDLPHCDFIDDLLPRIRGHLWQHHKTPISEIDTLTVRQIRARLQCDIDEGKIDSLSIQWTADAEKLRSSVNNSISGGLSGISDQIGQMSSKVLSFQGVLRIGLGGQVMREIFHGLHAAAKEFIEGIAGAREANEGWIESVTDGGRALLGMQTHFAETAKRAKELKETLESLQKTSSAASNVLSPEKKEFEYLPGADKALADLVKAQRDAAAIAQPGFDEIARFKSMIGSVNPNGRIAGAPQAILNAIYQKQLGEQQDKWKNQFAALDIANNAVTDYQQRFSEANFTSGLGIASSNASTWSKMFTDLGKAFASPFEKIATGFEKGFAEEAKQRAEEGRKIYDETRSPLEKHANAMNDLHDLLDAGTISPELFARRKQQFDQEYEKATTFDQTPSRLPSQRGGIEAVDQFAKQLQDSILGNDPPTGKKQDEANKHLQNIDDNMKAAASAEFMFA
jgi:hypothetical protein